MCTIRGFCKDYYKRFPFRGLKDWTPAGGPFKHKLSIIVRSPSRGLGV